MRQAFQAPFPIFFFHEIKLYTVLVRTKKKTTDIKKRKNVFLFLWGGGFKLVLKLFFFWLEIGDKSVNKFNLSLHGRRTRTELFSLCEFVEIKTVSLFKRLMVTFTGT